MFVQSLQPPPLLGCFEDVLFGEDCKISQVDKSSMKIDSIVVIEAAVCCII
jgi:hypothetical protein